MSSDLSEEKFKLNINNNNAVVIANGRKIPNVDDIVIDFGD